MGQEKYVNGFRLSLHPQTLELPLKWKKPQRIFVNSMSDLFHKDVPMEYIQKVFATMRMAHWHQFQILTKRSGRLLAFTESIDWPPNVWMGVSVESAEYKSRIDHLRKTGAEVKFLSLEPLIGDLGELNLKNIDWVIVGGESGPGARAMQPAWVRTSSSSASALMFHFSSSNGEAFRRSAREGNSAVARTTRCP